MNKVGILTSLDIFGITFNFRYNGESKYKTKIGGLLTIVYLIIIFSLFMGFGIDLYERKNPRVSFNTKMEPYEQRNLSNQNFTLAYRIEDQSGQMVERSEIIYIELSIYSTKLLDTGVWDELKFNIQEPRRCKELPSTTEKEKYYNISLQQWYCVDFDNVTLGGNWDGNFVNGLQINTYQCQNKTNAFGKNMTCLPQEELNKAFYNEITSSNFFFSYLYLEDLPTMDDYEAPLKSNLINRYEMLNLQITKRAVHTYKEVEVKNDVGWLFASLNSDYMYASDQIMPDFTPKDIVDQDILFTYLLYFSKKHDIYNRSYTKVQEVFAAIGGFSKFFYTMIYFLYSWISITLKNVKLINSFQFDDEMIEDVYPPEENKINHINHIRVSSLSPVNLSKFNILSRQSHMNIINYKPQEKTKRSYCSKILFACCHYHKKNDTKLINYPKYREYFEKALNVFTYFNFLHEFQQMKKVMLNENQLEIFNAIKCKLKDSENFDNDTDSIAKSEMTKKKISTYYSNLQSNNQLDNVSKKIFNLLNKNTQKAIFG
jgi:hypothetical protein